MKAKHPLDCLERVAPESPVESNSGKLRNQIVEEGLRVWLLTRSHLNEEFCRPLPKETGRDVFLHLGAYLTEIALDGLKAPLKACGKALHDRYACGDEDSAVIGDRTLVLPDEVCNVLVEDLMERRAWGKLRRDACPK